MQKPTVEDLFRKMHVSISVNDQLPLRRIVRGRDLGGIEQGAVVLVPMQGLACIRIDSQMDSAIRFARDETLLRRGIGNHQAIV